MTRFNESIDLFWTICQAFDPNGHTVRCETMRELGVVVKIVSVAQVRFVMILLSCTPIPVVENADNEDVVDDGLDAQDGDVGINYQPARKTAAPKRKAVVDDETMDSSSVDGENLDREEDDEY